MNAYVLMYHKGPHHILVLSLFSQPAKELQMQQTCGICIKTSINGKKKSKYEKVWQF